MNWKAHAILALVGFGAFQQVRSRPLDPGPVVVAAVRPAQAETDAAGFPFKGHTLQPLQSSLSRIDTGPGACEIIFVRHLQVL